MKFFIDTADTQEIRAASDLGLVDGVTTNPSLVARTGRGFKNVGREKNIILKYFQITYAVKPPRGSIWGPTTRNIKQSLGFNAK
jgi:hypothetical protein